MADDLWPCAACGGRLKWFDTVKDWRHVQVPDGALPHVGVREVFFEEPEHDQLPPSTIGAEGYVAELVETERPVEVQRIVETREEIEARGRAMREALGVIEPYTRSSTPIQIAKVVDETRLTEHPAPLVPARPATDEELPSSARTLLNLLRAEGWQTDQQYARGWRPDVHRRKANTYLVDVVVVRGRRPEMAEMVVACWSTPVEADEPKTKYDGGYWRVPGGTEMLGATELKKKIKIPVMRCDACGVGPYAHTQEECS